MLNYTDYKTRNQDISDKPLPIAKDAEDGLINLAIHNSECLYKLDEARVNENFFYGHYAAYMYKLLTYLSGQAKGQHPTKFTTVRALNKEQDKGYLDYYTQISNEVHNPQNFDTWLDTLVDFHKKREVIRTNLEAIQMCYDDNVKADAILTATITKLETVDSCINPLELYTDERLEKMLRDDYVQAPTRPKGAKWPIKELNLHTGGTRYGELGLLYAEPGLGKSSLLWETAYQRSYERPQLYITIGDMTIPQLWRRGMQQLTGVSSIDQSQGKFRDNDGYDQWNEIDFHLKSLGKRQLYLYQNENMEVGDVRRIAKRLLRNLPGLDIYIDHIGQFRDKGDLYEKTMLVSSTLLSCAHNIVDDNYNPRVSITAISPINKKGEFVGAMDLAHAAENIFKLERAKANEGGANLELPPSEQSGVVLFKILKNRNGGAGTVKLWFDAPKARFTQLPDSHKMG